MKTYSHDELTRRAVVWLHRKQWKGDVFRTGFETDLGSSNCIGDGYIADLVAIGYLDYEEMQKHGCGKLVGRDVWAWPVNPPVMIVESKANRADYINTFGPNGKKNRLKPVGNLHWIVANHGVVAVEEVPDPWGLLVPRSQGLTEVKVPMNCEVSVQRLEHMAKKVMRKVWESRHDRYIKRIADCGLEPWKWAEFNDWLKDKRMTLQNLIEDLMSGKLVLASDKKPCSEKEEPQQ